jgi:mitogen-activated protein kinase kinase kinase
MKGTLLGMGSYGSVYLGLNQHNGELFAAKQVELDKGNDERKQMMVKQFAILISV